MKRLRELESTGEFINFKNMDEKMNKNIKDFKIDIIIKKDFESELDNIFECFDILAISKKHRDKYCEFGKCADIAFFDRGKCPHSQDRNFLMDKSLFDKDVCEYEKRGDYIIIDTLIRSETRSINNLNQFLSNATLEFSIKEIDYREILALLKEFNKEKKYNIKLKKNKDNTEMNLTINDLIISYKYSNDEKCFELENESATLYMPNIRKVKKSIAKKTINTAGQWALIETTPALKIYDDNHIFIIYDYEKSETQIERYTSTRSIYGHLCGEDCIGEDCAYWAGKCLG